MAIIASDTWSGIGLNVNLNGRTLDNGAGGGGTRQWVQSNPGGNAMRSHQTIANRAMGGSTNASSSVDMPEARLLRAIIYPRTDGTNTFPAIGIHGRYTLSDRSIPWLSAMLHTSATRLELGHQTASSFTSRAAKTITNPAVPIVLTLDARDPTAVVASLHKLSDSELIDSVTYNFGSLPAGTFWGFQLEQGGLGESWGNLVFEDAPINPAPLLTSPTGTATGSQTASGTVTTDTASGTLYAALSATDLTAAAIIALNNSQAVTTTGVKTFAFSGASPGATGVKTQFVHVRPTGEQSSVARSAAFNLNTPLPAPDTTVTTTVGTHTVGGVDHLAIILTGVATNAANVSASMPAASPANGAVTRPAQSVAPDGGGNWVIRFLDPPAGDYDYASILLSNVDNPSVAKSGDKKVQIIPIGGEAPGPGGDPEADTENPVMTGSLSSSNLTSTSYDISGYGATDNVGVAGYERSLDAGSTWLSVGGATSFSVSGRTPGATDQVRVRASDFAGNRAATPLSLAVTLQSAGDTTAPVMQGTISLSNLTHNSYTTGVDAATDNVAVTGYRVSQDGGTTWIDKGSDRTHSHTGRTPGATDQVRWSARDAAGNWATPLSRAVTLADAAVAPSITTQPASTTRTEGQTATFSVVASGTAPLSYQWRRGGVDISGATSASFTTATLGLSDNGSSFTCVVTNSAGSVTSAAAVLTVQAEVTMPSITAHPSSVSREVGQTATFTVAATGTAPLTYQWLRGGVAISGATSSSYTTPALTLADDAAQYSCRVENSAGNVASNIATLTVTAVPVEPGQTEAYRVRMPAAAFFGFMS